MNNTQTAALNAASVVNNIRGIHRRRENLYKHVCTHFFLRRGGKNLPNLTIEEVVTFSVYRVLTC